MSNKKFKRSALVKAERELVLCTNQKRKCVDCTYFTDKGTGCRVKNTQASLLKLQEQEKNMFKVIVAGSRDFTNDSITFRVMDRVLLKQIEKGRPIQIVSGGARGADASGERYAQMRDYDLKIINANWKKDGKSAGYKRNTRMANYASGLVAFWDGKSRGTAHMIKIALGKKMPVVVHSITKDVSLYSHKEKDLAVIQSRVKSALSPQVKTATPVVEEVTVTNIKDLIKADKNNLEKAIVDALSKKKVKELKQMAKNKEIQGYSKLNKSPLIRAIVKSMTMNNVKYFIDNSGYKLKGYNA